MKFMNFTNTSVKSYLFVKIVSGSRALGKKN